MLMVYRAYLHAALSQFFHSLICEAFNNCTSHMRKSCTLKNSSFHTLGNWLFLIDMGLYSLCDQQFDTYFCDTKDSWSYVGGMQSSE